MTRLGKYLTFFIVSLLFVSSQLYAVSPPTGQAKYLTFSNITGTQATASWINGNGGHRIVVVKETPFTDPATVNPIPNQQFTVVTPGLYGNTNPTLGDGWVVYNGSGVNRSVTLTNLTAGHTYYVKVFEYAVGVGTSPNYQLADHTVLGPPVVVTNPRSFSTPSVAPTLGTTTPIGPVGAILNWDALPGATSYTLQVFQGTDGGTVLPNYDQIDVGNVTSFELGGLTDGTGYSYRICAVVNGSLTVWSLYGNFTTVSDTNPPTFMVQYYSDNAYTTLMPSPVFLKPGTYYVKITSVDLSGLAASPKIGFNSEPWWNGDPLTSPGLNYLPTNQPTVWLSNSLTILGGVQEFAYTRTINPGGDANATLNDLPLTNLSGIDASGGPVILNGNVADNVHPTNTGYVVYIDNTLPTIAPGAAIAPCDTYVDVTFSEQIRHADGTIVQASDFATNFAANGGDATGATIGSITNNTDGPLTLTDLTIRFNISITGAPSGVETINIKPATASSVVDRAGNAMDIAQGTGVLTLVSLPGITTGPTNQSACTGNSATFTATIVHATDIHWQKYDGVSAWDDITALTDGGVYTGFTTQTLSVSNVNGLSGSIYRVTAQTTGCPATPIHSGAASLTVSASLAFAPGGQPTTPVTICQGGNASFTVAVTGDGTKSYQWQHPVPNPADPLNPLWVNLPADPVYGSTTQSRYRCNIYCWSWRRWYTFLSMEAKYRCRSHLD